MSHRGMEAASFDSDSSGCDSFELRLSDDEDVIDSTEVSDEGRQERRDSELIKRERSDVRGVDVQREKNDHECLDLLDDENNIDSSKVFDFLSHLLNVTVVVKKLSDFTISKYQVKPDAAEETVRLANNAANAANVKVTHKDNVIEILTCHSCQKSFDKKHSLRNHMANCKNDATSASRQLHQPSKCGVRCLSSKYCSRCDKVFQHDTNLNVKKRQFCEFCESALRLQCNMCSGIYASYTRMQVHLKVKCVDTWTHECYSDPFHRILRKLPSTSLRYSTSRHCEKCAKTAKHDANLSVKKTQYCGDCGSAMLWQCSKCEYTYRSYSAVSAHAKYSCACNETGRSVVKKQGAKRRSKN